MENLGREKQIEEMARDICECFNNDGTCYQDDKLCDCKCDSFTDAQYLYEKGYRKQEWISVDEGLPPKYEKVLVFDRGVINTSWIGSQGVWYDHSMYSVTHWMPLPEVPKMKGGAE